MAPRFIGIWGGQDNHSQLSICRWCEKSGIENVALSMNVQPLPTQRYQKEVLSDHLTFTIHGNTTGSGCREMTACNAANRSRSHFSTAPLTHRCKSMQVDLWVQLAISGKLTDSWAGKLSKIEVKAIMSHSVSCGYNKATGWRKSESKLKNRPAERLQKPHEDPTCVTSAVESGVNL